MAASIRSVTAMPSPSASRIAACKWPAPVSQDVDSSAYIKEFNDKMLPGTGPYAVTPADLEKEGRDLLAVMGVSQGTMNAFYANPNLSPTDKIVIVKVLESLGGIQRRELFVAGAAKAPSVEMGFFYRHQAMLIQQYAKRVSPVRGFVSVGGAPMLMTA